MVEVSVVIPTYNRVDRLKRVLAAFELQTFPKDRFEVVVVSDGSNDGTHEYLEALITPIQLKHYCQSNQGPAAARNRGVQLAAGELIVFVDDDVIPSPEIIAEHVAYHRQNDGDCVVIGPMLSPDDFKYSPWVSWEQAKLAKYYRDMLSGQLQPSPRMFYTGNASLSREQLIKSGGFDDSLRRAEDVELAYRLETMGLRFLFNPRAVGYHYAERSFISWQDIPYQYGKNDVIFAREKGQTWLSDDIFRELFRRNWLTRSLVRICLGRPVVTAVVLSLLKAVIVTSDGLRLKNVSLTGCSAIFNLRYFQGACDQMGGEKKFFERLVMMKRRIAYVRAIQARRTTLD
jgi:glycosyltransferase involved in cell wall biosynthesis